MKLKLKIWVKMQTVKYRKPTRPQKDTTRKDPYHDTFRVKLSKSHQEQFLETAREWAGIWQGSEDATWNSGIP